MKYDFVLKLYKSYMLLVKMGNEVPAEFFTYYIATEGIMTVNSASINCLRIHQPGMSSIVGYSN